MIVDCGVNLDECCLAAISGGVRVDRKFCVFGDNKDGYYLIPCFSCSNEYISDSIPRLNTTDNSNAVSGTSVVHGDFRSNFISGWLLRVGVITALSLYYTS